MIPQFFTKITGYFFVDVSISHFFFRIFAQKGRIFARKTVAFLK